MFVSSYNVEMTIVQGRGLRAKDRHFLTRQRTTSDPYVVASIGIDHPLGKTKVCEKTLDPKFDATFHFSLPSKKIQQVPVDTCSFLRNEDGKSSSKMMKACGMVLLKIYDQDKLTDDDLMGTLVIPIPIVGGTHQPRWYSVDNMFVHNAIGELQIQLNVEPVRSVSKTGKFSLPSPDKVSGWMKGVLGKTEEANEHNVVVDTSSAKIPDRKSYMMALFKAFQ